MKNDEEDRGRNTNGTTYLKSAEEVRKLHN